MTGHSPETRYLAKVDPVMRRLIRKVGPFTLVPRVRRSPFESLARAIAFQQLHEKAAESILKRFIGSPIARRPRGISGAPPIWPRQSRKGAMAVQPCVRRAGMK